MTSYSLYDCLVIGTGFAGAVAARELAERGHKKVLIIDKRDHIGGNSYDHVNEHGILVHKYGPHIFHTNHERVYDYLSRFTEWNNYEHKVVGNIYGMELPIPFNLNSLHMVYEKPKADKIENELVSNYGIGSKVSILELKKNANPELSKLADYVYKNIFLYYTQKQWGTSPDKINPEVTARVPVHISRDNRYFQDKFQGMPRNGYAALFERLLDHPNIDISLLTDAKKIISFSGNSIFLFGASFNGIIVYTGAVDELFEYRFGKLPYRTLDFKFENYDKEWFQKYGTVNYTVDQDFTRITEFKHLTGQKKENKTTIVKEFPKAYTNPGAEIPYYPINNDENDEMYNSYRKLASVFPDFYLLGRLAEYKYYNMDAIVYHALKLSDTILNKEEHKK